MLPPVGSVNSISANPHFYSNTWQLFILWRHHHRVSLAHIDAWFADLCHHCIPVRFGRFTGYFGLIWSFQNWSVIITNIIVEVDGYYVHFVFVSLAMIQHMNITWTLISQKEDSFDVKVAVWFLNQKISERDMNKKCIIPIGKILLFHRLGSDS